MDDLGFVEAIDRLGQRVVVRVADAAYGRFDPGFSETLGVLDRNILAAPIAMVDEATSIGGPSVMKRLLQGIQDKVGVRGPAGSPADDPPSIGVDDEGDVDEAGPGRDISEVGKPKDVRPRGLELTVDVIQGAWRGLVVTGWERVRLERIARLWNRRCLPPCYFRSRLSDSNALRCHFQSDGPSLARDITGQNESA